MAEAEARTSVAENPLCSRLQTKFSGRGVAAATDPARVANTRPQAKDTAVRRTVNPFEETAKFTPAAKTAAPADKVRSAAEGRIAAFEKTTPFESGAYAKAYARAAGIRARAYTDTAARTSTFTKAQPKKKRSFRQVMASIFNADATRDEVKVANPKISKGLIIGIVLFAVVVMMIIYSFSAISEFKQEISSLENKKAELTEEISELSLRMDMKEDIRTIEKIATEELGMVKSNRVESKYINLTEGDRIEVVNNSDGADTNDYGIFSTMLSTVGSNWDTVLDYIN